MAYPYYSPPPPPPSTICTQSPPPPSPPSLSPPPPSPVIPPPLESSPPPPVPIMPPPPPPPMIPPPPLDLSPPPPIPIMPPPPQLPPIPTPIPNDFSPYWSPKPSIAPSSHHHHHHTGTYVAVFGCLGAFAVLGLLAFALFCCVKKKKKKAAMIPLATTGAYVYERDPPYASGGQAVDVTIDNGREVHEITEVGEGTSYQQDLYNTNNNDYHG